VEEQGQFAEPVGDGTILAFDGTVRTEAQSAFGLGLDYEYLFSDRIGFTAGVSSANHDVDLHLGGDFWITDEFTGELLLSGTLDETETIGDVTSTALTLGANFHFGTGDKYDFYAAPLLAWVTFGDLEAQGEVASFDDDLTFGAALGMDIPFGAGRWSFSAKMQYLDAKADLKSSAGGGEFLILRPVALQAGLAYRF
jgi:outer membrane protein W